MNASMHLNGHALRSSIRARCNAFALACKLGRRELRRNPLPTALIIGLIAAPAALATAVATTQHRFEAVENRWDFETRALSAGETTGVTLPHGAEIAQFSQSRLEGSLVRTGAPIVLNDIVVGLSPDALFLGQSLQTGRYPKAKGEAVVDQVLIEIDGVRIGDRIRVPRPSGTTTHTEFKVTGIVAGLPIGNQPRAMMLGLEDPTVLANDTVITWLKLRNHNVTPEQIFTETRRHAWRNLHTESAFAAPFLAVFSAVLMLVCLVASAAVSVVAQRRLRTCALLRTNGATSATAGGSLFLYASLCGLLGGFVGAVVGVTLTGALNSLAQTAVPGAGVPWAWLLAIPMITMAAAGLASLRLAVSSRHMIFGDRLESGHRQRSWVLGLGAGMVALGGWRTWTATRMGGGNLQWFPPLASFAAGLALLMPTVARLLGTLGTRGPRTLRWSARSIGRSAHRTGAALAAIGAAAALTTYVGTQAKTAVAEIADPNQAVKERLVMFTPHTDKGEAQFEQLRRIAQPQASVVIDTYVSVSDGTLIARGSDEVWDALHLSVADRRSANEALRSNAVVVVSASPNTLVAPSIANSRVVVFITTPLPRSWSPLPSFVSDQRLQVERLGPAARPKLLLRLDRPPTQETLDRLQRVTSSGGKGYGRSATMHHEPRALNGWSWASIATLLSAIAVAVTLIITITTVGLQAAESRRDRAIMVSIGASSSMGARLAGMTAFLIAGAATLLCAPAGVAIGWLVQEGASRRRIATRSVVVPWEILSVLIVGAPVLAAAVVWSASALSGRFRPTPAVRDWV
jgi:hypothetical protein